MHVAHVLLYIVRLEIILIILVFVESIKNIILSNKINLKMK